MEDLKDKYDEITAMLKEQLTNYEATAKHLQGVQGHLAQIKDTIIALRAQLGLLENLDPRLKEKES